MHWTRRIRGIREKRPLGAGLASVTLLLAAAADAHHSFTAEFDADAPVVLRGKVTRVEWINPHAWIHLDIAPESAPEGAPSVSWMIEGGTPNTLLRAGIDRNTVRIGTEVVVRGYQAKDKSCQPACKANGRDITFADGRKLFMGSSGTGAPRDGSDPREGKRPKP